MSDVIDFNKIKNTATDKDIDKFEQYISDLYFSVAQGTVTMGDMINKVNKYKEENNISDEKFESLQKKLVERYSSQFGIDFNNIEGELSKMGVNPSDLSGYEDTRKEIGFREKYGKSLTSSQNKVYTISNKLNNLTIEMDKENVTLISEKKIDLDDNELHEFLVSYKKIIKDKKLEITMCENVKRYQY